MLMDIPFDFIHPRAVINPMDIFPEVYDFMVSPISPMSSGLEDSDFEVFGTSPGAIQKSNIQSRTSRIAYAKSYRNEMNDLINAIGSKLPKSGKRSNKIETLKRALKYIEYLEGKTQS